MVERETVETLLSLGHWFDSGWRDDFTSCNFYFFLELCEEKESWVGAQDPERTAHVCRDWL